MLSLFLKSLVPNQADRVHNSMSEFTRTALQRVAGWGCILPNMRSTTALLRCGWGYGSCVTVMLQCCDLHSDLIVIINLCKIPHPLDQIFVSTFHVLFVSTIKKKSAPQQQSSTEGCIDSIIKAMTFAANFRIPYF